MKPTLLLFNFSDEKAAKLRFVAMRLAIGFRQVTAEEFGQPLGALCGLLPVQEPAPAGEAFSDEMLVMADFPQGMVNRFLQTMRQMKLPPVALKAILTDTNAQWNAAQLHEQLSAEHEAFLQRGAMIHE